MANGSEGEPGPRSQIVVTQIEEQSTIRGISINGAHLVSHELAASPERQGDGYLLIPFGERGIIAFVIDISLAKDVVADTDGQLINEQRLVKDLTCFINQNSKGLIAEADQPQLLLRHIREKFYPPYLGAWNGRLDWGFSITAAVVVPKTDIKTDIKVVSMGTNFVAKEKSGNLFSVVISSNSKFFSPAIKNKVGGPVEISKEQSFKMGQTLLLATDGIVIKRSGLLSLERKVDLNVELKALLGTNEEGLYLVIKS